MENNLQVISQESGSKSGKTNKGLIVLLVIIVMGLGAAVGVMLSKLKDQQKEFIEKEELLESHRKILEDDLTDLQEQFGALQTNNDSLLNLAAEQQDRITRLLAIQADNASRIRTYQRELETLRGVLRGYLVQVDSLMRRDIELTRERDQLARNLAAEQTQTARLSADLERQTSTVQIAQVLSASDVRVTGFNNRDRETPRVRNIVKLQTCFIVRGNQVAQPGERIVYLVLVKPDRRVLLNRTNATFMTQEGAEIIYTDRRVIDYDNKDIEVCIFTDNENRLTDGNYEARIYCDGYLIGTSSFVLR